MNRPFNLIPAVAFAEKKAVTIVFTVLIAAWCVITTAEGASYYTSPSGSGNTCSPTNPCSVPTGLSKAKSGDKLILKDGVYNNLKFDTNNPGVTIEAENKHGAVIRNGSGHIIGIRHSNTIIRGLHINGMGTAGDSVGIIRFYASSDVIIEHNLIENIGGAPINVGGSVRTAAIRDVIIRHNILRDTGLTAEGEAIYIGSGYPEYGGTVANVQVYGNIATRFTQNGVDFKPTTENVDAHHNIFEGQYYHRIPQKPGVESTVVMRNKNHRFHDNIIRDISDAGNGVIWVEATHNAQVYRNVIKNVTKTSNAIATRNRGPGGTPSQVYNNTFCNLANYGVSAEFGLKVYNNNGLPGGAPASACDAEIKRILSEMNSLPGISCDGSSPSFEAPSNLRVVTVK